MNATRSAFVAGGTGGIGEGIVKFLLQAGYQVFVPVRASDKSSRLQDYVHGVGPGVLELVSGDLADPASVSACRSEVQKKVSKLDLVVVSVGSSLYGHSLHRLAMADWNRLIVENLATHFLMIREFLNVLYEQNHGTFVTLTGPEADFVQAETGLVSVVAAAQKMMARVAAQEALGSGVRVYSVTSKKPVATRQRGEQNEPDWLSAADLGRYVWALAEDRVKHPERALHELHSLKALENELV